MVHRPALVGIALAAAFGVLAGCTSSGSGGKAGSSAAPSSPTLRATKASTSPVVQHSLPPASAIKNYVSKRKAVSLTACAATATGWQATGRVTNKSSKAVSYVITVFFTTKGATVMDYAKTTVRVKSGKTAAWHAAAKFHAPQTTLCVLRGVG